MTGLPDNTVMHAPLTAHLCVDGAAAAIDFYIRALGATEMMRLPGPDGRLIHASILVNGAMVMLNDEYPEMGGLGPKRRGGTSVTLHLRVADADAAVERSVEAGAKLVMPVEDQFWGDRYGVVEDPFGHQWSFATPVRHVSQTELKDIAAKMS
jgi:PhnB protein